MKRKRRTAERATNGHPRPQSVPQPQRVELLLHIIYDNLDSVAGPRLHLRPQTPNPRSEIPDRQIPGL